MGRASGLLSQDARRGTPDWPGAGYSLPDRWKGGRINQSRPKWVQRCFQKLADRVSLVAVGPKGKPGSGSATRARHGVVYQEGRSLIGPDYFWLESGVLNRRLFKQVGPIIRRSDFSRRIQQALAPVNHRDGGQPSQHDRLIDKRPRRSWAPAARRVQPTRCDRSGGVICCRCLP